MLTHQRRSTLPGSLASNGQAADANDVSSKASQCRWRAQNTCDSSSIMKRRFDTGHRSSFPQTGVSFSRRQRVWLRKLSVRRRTRETPPRCGLIFTSRVVPYA